MAKLTVEELHGLRLLNAYKEREEVKLDMLRFQEQAAQLMLENAQLHRSGIQQELRAVTQGLAALSIQIKRKYGITTIEEIDIETGEVHPKAAPQGGGVAPAAAGAAEKGAGSPADAAPDPAAADR